MARATAGARVTTDHRGGEADGIVDLNLTGTEHQPGDQRWRTALTRSVEPTRDRGIER